MKTSKTVLQIALVSIVTVSATTLAAEEDKSVKSQSVTATVEGTLKHENLKVETTCPDEKNNIPEMKGTWKDRRKSNAGH